VTENIHYETRAIAEFFSQHRVRWTDFYESERRIIAELGLGPKSSILDIGCGCGGLGLALREQFGVESYTGVEINEPAAETGRALNPRATILCGDVLDLTSGALKGRAFSAVFSLSCLDWNVRFADMLHAAWSHVAPGGHLVATFRLTDEPGCEDFERSRQYINYEERLEGELAPYVVLNAGDLMDQLRALAPSEVRAFGYWGPPSKTAVTPYEKLCFAAFSVRKRAVDDEGKEMQSWLDLPGEIRRLMTAA
jgi:SAM-dependent methyltransferase